MDILMKKKDVTWYIAISCMIQTFWSVSALAQLNGGSEPEESPETIQVGYTLPVNDDAVTSAQVIARLREYIGDTEVRNMSKDEFVREYATKIQELVMRQVYQLLQYQYSRKELEKRDIPDEAIDRILNEKKNELIAKYGGSEAELRAKLAEEGYSLDERLDEEKRQIVIDAYQQFNFLPTLTITRSDMLTYYRRHRDDEFYEAPKIKFQLIDIYKDENGGPVQAREIAEKALEELEGGADFAEVARRYSNGFRRKEGGMWPLYNPESLRSHYQPVVNAMEKIEIGAITGIVDGENRYFIGKLLERHPESIVPFAESQETIKTKIQQQRWQEYSRKLTDELMEKSSIGDVEKFMINTLMAAYEQLTR